MAKNLDCMKRKPEGKKLKKRILLVALLTFCAISFSAQAHITGKFSHSLKLSDETVTELARTYAPVLWFYKDSLWEEPFALIEAEYFIDVSHTNDSGNLKLSEEGYEGAKTLQTQYNGTENPVYVRVTTDEYAGKKYVVIQYWFHYLYNYGGILSLLNFNHEGEWEMIEVILEYDESILNGIQHAEPALVAYSRHSSGKTHKWENESVEKEERSHPVAYIAYGTHAAYFEDLGWNEDLNKGIRVDHNDMHFIPVEEKEWLQFSGKWGGQENSPSGPMFQEEKWAAPVLWAVTYLDNYQIHLGDQGDQRHLLIKNKTGQRIGFVGEQFVNEIQDAYGVVTDEDEYYYLPKDEYSVEMSELEEGEIDFDVVVTEDGEATFVSYEDELKTTISKVYTEISENVEEFALRLDEDGDGKIEMWLEPKIAGYKGENGLMIFIALCVGFVVLIVMIFKASHRQKAPEKLARTRLDVVGRILERVAAAFFLLWIIAAVTDVLGRYEYETEFLQCAVGLYLLSRALPVFSRQYSAGRKIQVLLTRLGWPLVGLWALFEVLRWSGWVGTVEIGVDIGYFLVIGGVFLVMGYTVKSVRVMRKHWILRLLLFIIGIFLAFSWILMRGFSYFPEYANYVLVAGIVAVSLVVVSGGLKRSVPPIQG